MSRLTVLAFWLVAVGVSLVLISGLSPWPLILFCLASVAVLIRRRTSTLFAAAATVIFHLALVAVVIQIVPATGLPLGVSVTAIELAEVFILAAWFTLRPPPPLRMRSQGSRAISWLLAMIVPLASVVLVGIGLALGRSSVAWAMNNDAPYNLMTGRLLFSDGGVVSRLHFNGSPEPQTLFAVVSAPGRWTASEWDLLRYDVSAYAQMWFALIIASSFFAALIARQTLARRGLVRRSSSWFDPLATGVVALLPLTFFATGYAVRFGFVNATLALVILLAAWLVAQSISDPPQARVTVLGLATVALLATWGPLAIVTLALAIRPAWTLIVNCRKDRGLSALSMPSAVALLIMGYVVTVTVPDLLSQGGKGLSNDGGIMALGPGVVIAITLACLVFLVVQARLERDSTTLIDGATMVVAGGAGLAFLIYQRWGQATLWTYYPIKFSWTLITVLGIVTAAVVMSLLARWRFRAGLVAVLAVLGVVVGGVSLASPATRTVVVEALSVVGIAGFPERHPAEAAVDFMLDNKQAGVNTIVVGALTPEADAFINFWLFQMEPDLNDIGVRKFAYGVDVTNTTELCQAISALRPPVRIVSIETNLGARLAEVCPQADVQIVSPRS